MGTTGQRSRLGLVTPWLNVGDPANGKQLWEICHRKGSLLLSFLHSILFCLTLSFPRWNRSVHKSGWVQHIGELVNNDFAPFPFVQINSVFWHVDLNRNLSLRSPFTALKQLLTFRCSCKENASSDGFRFWQNPVTWVWNKVEPGWPSFPLYVFLLFF